jgi:RNA polymerase sigma-70 factor (ECF subfamily)
VTRWSVVRTAGQDSSPDAKAALAQLCSVYWFPLYAYVRHQGHSVHDAQDLTQGFFAAFLAGDYLGGLAPEKGKFRAFLLACLKHFLSNQRDRERALKRGGDQVPVSWDAMDAEQRLAHQPRHDLAPDRLYEREWALTLLDHVLMRLEEEMVRGGKKRQFECLKGCLAINRESLPYAEVAEQLEVSEGAVKVAVHRLRRRYRRMLREEIAHTVMAPDMVDDELQALFAALQA